MAVNEVANPPPLINMIFPWLLVATNPSEQRTHQAPAR